MKYIEPVNKKSSPKREKDDISVGRKRAQQKSRREIDGLENWAELREYTPMKAARKQSKNAARQTEPYTKMKVGLKSNLIALLDQTWPGVNTFFNSPVRSDGQQKWIDFTYIFGMQTV